MISLDELRDSLEGAVPSLVATCSAEGIPNVCYVSQVEYVDSRHVAMSFQFFNKTRQNVLSNAAVTAAVVDPVTAALHRLSLRYLRTEVDGPIFERMKAKLASIATMTGTTGVFRVRGADIYRVDAIERLAGQALPKVPGKSRLTALRAASDLLVKSRNLGELLDRLLDALGHHFGIEHAMVLAIDEKLERFYTLASRGYPTSGVGSELPLGVGTVGVAALRRTPIRLTYATADYAYVRAIRERAAQDPAYGPRLENTIPFPGLSEPHSQLSVPIEVGERVMGVLHVESSEERKFSYEDEDALVALVRQFAFQMQGFAVDEEPNDAPEGAPQPSVGTPLVVRHFAANDSVFIGDEYLIKGVAGAIFWTLVKAFVHEGREHFSNRELRVDPALKLPSFSDNLEARLVLLERRLRERDVGVLLEKTGRGRFRLFVDHPLQLVEAG